ncbi:MAG: filamentous hemagglutinin N-terminal domain-containing protein [Proteobacteria bacterium]|uniref:Filamentous hemagglutinin N-terminal domain-containing protein n=1 Tax=Candidatus Avisuccinivibrio stercorigallinarum TaxID=2840704 RepID=A0A9D9GPY0_9GAMM|nr:filamentous hemagglutinin N-terminal domain-containing protein [Candidatus Avisuccinivibrio stercorigallinarum]
MQRQNFRNGLKAMALCLGAALLSSAQAGPNTLPVFDKVIHGQAQVDKRLNTMSVSGKGAGSANVLQWQSFDVGKNSSVYFRDGNFLNLIRDRKASDIYGRIEVSGQGSAYFVNPYGINLHKGSTVQGVAVGFSTAKPSAEMVDTFIKTSGLDGTNPKVPDFAFTGKGMGKVRLLGIITAENLFVDAGQIIIRDANLLQNYGAQGDGNISGKDELLYGNEVKLQSSVQRIDVGFASEDGSVDYLKDTDDLHYTILNEEEHSSLISHAGEIPLSDEKDFEQLKQTGEQTKEYWLTNNVELTLDDSLTGDAAFTGSLDGVGNRVEYTQTLDADSAQNTGLFSSIEGGTVKNLLITNSTLDLTSSTGGSTGSGGTGDAAQSALNAGALAGTIKDATLENVEVDNFTLKLPEADALPCKVNAGALTGTLADSTLSNVTAGFAESNAQVLAKLNNTGGDQHIGALAGQSTGSISKSGVTAGLNKDAGLKAIAKDDAGAALSSSFEDGFNTAAEAATAGSGADADAAQTLTDQYAAAANRSSGHLKIFMQPFFVENFEYTYDGTGHDYAALNRVTVSGSADGQDPQEHTIFELTDCFDFNNNEHSEDGLVKDAGMYEYELTNTQGFDGFYLVQPEQVTTPVGQTSQDSERYTIDGRTETLTGHGYIKINKRQLGTIEIGDVTITQGESLDKSDITAVNASELNFAPGEKLTDFAMQLTKEPDTSQTGDQEISVNFAGLDKNYIYTVDNGTLTVQQKDPDPDPNPGTDPDPEPDPEPTPDPGEGGVDGDDGGDDGSDPTALPDPGTSDFPDLPLVPDSRPDHTAMLALSAEDTEVTKCTYCQGRDSWQPSFAKGLGLVHGNQGQLMSFAGSFKLPGQLFGDLLLASGSGSHPAQSTENEEKGKSPSDAAGQARKANAAL